MSPRPRISRQSRSKPAPVSLSRDELTAGIRQWVRAAEMALRSPLTAANRRRCGERLLWFLEYRGLSECGESEIIEFLAYVSTAHLQPGGRWQELERDDRWGQSTIRGKEPVKPSTVGWYYDHLRGLFNYLVKREKLTETPMKHVEKPHIPDEQIQPFTAEQVRALLAAAAKTRCARRDIAILLFLLDTGCRASELLSLRVGDLSMEVASCWVLGKGGKRRELHFESHTETALWDLLDPGRKGPAPLRHAPLFCTLFGKNAGEPLAREGLQHLFKSLGGRAGITGVRCSPHTMRHTMAVNWLKAGGDIVRLQRILGHTSLSVTRRYIALTDADVSEAYRTFSPVEFILRGKRRP